MASAAALGLLPSKAKAQKTKNQVNSVDTKKDLAKKPNEIDPGKEIEKKLAKDPEASFAWKAIRAMDPTTSQLLAYAIYYFSYPITKYKAAYKEFNTWKPIEDFEHQPEYYRIDPISGKEQARILSDEELRLNLTDDWVNAWTDFIPRLIITAPRFIRSVNVANEDKLADFSAQTAATNQATIESKLLSTSATYARIFTDRYLTNALHYKARKLYINYMAQHPEYQNLPWKVPLKVQLSIFTRAMKGLVKDFKARKLKTKRQLELLRQKIIDHETAKGKETAEALDAYHQLIAKENALLKSIKETDKAQIAVDAALITTSYLLPLANQLSPKLGFIANTASGQMSSSIFYGGLCYRDIIRRMMENGDPQKEIEEQIALGKGGVFSVQIFFLTNLAIQTALNTAGLNEKAKDDIGYYHLQEMIGTVAACAVEMPLGIRMEIHSRDSYRNAQKENEADKKQKSTLDKVVDIPAKPFYRFFGWYIDPKKNGIETKKRNS